MFILTNRLQNTLEFTIMNPREDRYPSFDFDEKKERMKMRQEWLQSLSKSKTKKKR